MSSSFTVSDPGGPNTCLPLVSQVTFSSLPTMRRCNGSGVDVVVSDLEHARNIDTIPNPIQKALRESNMLALLGHGPEHQQPFPTRTATDISEHSGTRPWSSWIDMTTGPAGFTR